VDESGLTGESEPVRKNALSTQNYNSGADCTLVAKTLVTQGTGKAIVVAVGNKTVCGKIQEKAFV
jgi:magnesium-transporting ATPase (P-type)